MKRGIFMLGILILTLVMSPACKKEASPLPAQAQKVEVDGGYYWDISPAQLARMLEHKDFLFVNVHIPYEREIQETDLFIPYNEIEQNLSKLPENKGAKIVLYCRSGSMSAIAARTLVHMAFTNVWNLEGGMIEWERQGYQLTNKSK